MNVYQDSTEGDVSFNITAFDLAGNSLTVNQTQLNSSNLTIDQTNPTLSNLTIYSNNFNTSLATLGDTLNITITANEDLSSANIALLDATYTMSITGVVANASVIVNAAHADGKVEFNITAFDLAGNSLTVNQAQLHSPNLTIDKNVPSVANLTLYSNNSNSSLARAGDLINITLEASEQIYNATLEILGTEINMTESNNTAYANISVLQNSPNGPVAFNITAYDIAGNEFNVTQDAASANVIIDTANPALSNLTIYSNNFNTSLATLGDTLNITITANEDLSSANIALLDATYTMSITDMVANASVIVNAAHADGKVEFNITAFDLAGNSLTVNQAQLDSPNLTIDKNVPSVANLTLYSNNSNSSLARAGDLINITLEASEQIYNATLEILGTEINMTESNNIAYATISVLQNSPNGPVTFNITAYDRAGNEFNVTQDAASANVIIDTANPALSNLTIYSNNSRTDYAMAGHLLNITITANEALKDANITILDSTYVMSVNGTVANASVNVYQDSTEGDVSFNITAFDLAGNSLTVNQTQLNSSNLTIDQTNPTISNLTIYSNNFNTSLATLGDTLNITITANEDLSSANITLLDATYTMSITGVVANASVIVNAAHADGKVEFNITAFDLAGNSLTVNQAQLDSPNITIDENVPSVTNLTLYSNNSNSSLARAGDLINITLEASEQIYNATLEILGTEINMTESNNIAYANISVLQNSPNGPVTFNITAYDRAGNEFNVTQDDASANVIIDTANPALSNLTIYSNNSRTDYAMAGHLLNITITANEALKDANITILDSTYVMSVNGTVANASVNVYQDSTEGDVSFNITAFDLAGNSLTVNQTQLNSSNLTIDQTNPTISNLTIYSNNFNTSLATLGDTLNITITANEDLSSANIALLDATYTMSITDMVANASVIVNAAHADGKVEFNITAFDLAGNGLTVNQAQLDSPNLTIDKNVPSVANLTLYSNNSNSSLARAGDLINITLEASEQIYNATLEILGTEINMTESNNIAYANISVLQNSPNGPVTFNITAYDRAGNEFNVTQDDASANVIIDTANPALSNLTIYSNNFNTSLATLGDTLNITITANEDLSSANIALLDATYTMSITDMVANASVIVNAAHADGKVEFNITAFDLAGNSLTVNQAQLDSPNLTIDKNVPSVANLTLYSNNSNSSLARAGDLINITLEASEQIYNATLEILGTEINMTESNNTAYANISVLQNSPNGPVAFNITAYDIAGNEFNVTQDDASANVIIDTDQSCTLKSNHIQQ